MKHRAIKTLIVSEAPVVQAGLRALLRAPSIRVVGETQTVEEALRLTRGRRPDLVLLDAQRREQDLDHLRAIRETWPEVPVIIVMGSDRPGDLSRALANGCSGYLLRSEGRDAILKAIRAAARGERVVAPPLLQELLKEVSRQPVSLRGAPAGELTAPEKEVLQLITEGQTNRAIARHLGYSLGTVKDYVQKIIRKLGAADRTQAAITALRLGLLN